MNAVRFDNATLELQTMTRLQRQAITCRELLAYSVDRGDGYSSVTLTAGQWSQIDSILRRVESGEVIEQPAAAAPSYQQPGLLADEDGGALFSMQEG